MQNEIVLPARSPASVELEEAAKPLIDYLYKYGCPHSTVIVTQTSAELLSGECGVPFEARD